MLLHYAGAIGLGIAAGAAFAWLWLRVVPHDLHRRFWSAMSQLAREMLSVDEGREFLRLYGRLAKLLARYVGRNLGGTLLGCLPMIVILFTAAPLVFESWDARAPEGAGLERTARCASPGWCTLFASLGFEVVEAAPGELGGAPYAVTRPSHGDVNPLWPFLSDLEAAFFLAFIVSTFVGLLWPSRKPSLNPATTP
ncbi:MAG TPA: hypothetical protein VK043_04865 [Burkholderiales bacterium]|nr:hypothetical protein [Burkholderiales bacterium]